VLSTPWDQGEDQGSRGYARSHAHCLIGCLGVDDDPQVVMSWDAYSTCVAHALSTERQEIMGLLLGDCVREEGYGQVRTYVHMCTYVHTYVLVHW
jgi:hypothetical protein